jgi:serine/threonine protein kinase
MEIRFVSLAVALSDAAQRLHKGGLVHKDIKPTKVLVNSVIGQAWLTGFEMGRWSATTFDSYTG